VREKRGRSDGIAGVARTRLVIGAEGGAKRLVSCGLGIGVLIDRRGGGRAIRSEVARPEKSVRAAIGVHPTDRRSLDESQARDAAL